MFVFLYSKQEVVRKILDFLSVALNEATYASEANVRFALLLILVGAGTTLQICTDVFPRTSLDDFTTKYVWIRGLSIELIVWVHVVNKTQGGLGIYG